MPEADLAQLRRALREAPDLRPEHLFQGMPYVFRPERAQGLNVTYWFDLADEGSWTVRISGGECRTEPGAPEEHDVMIGCDGRTFLDMALGVVRPGEAFVDGRLRVAGDLGHAMRFSRLFGGEG